MSNNCKWLQDEFDTAWETDCGHSFSLNDGTPADNNMKFCCYCGKPILVPQSPETRSCEGTDVK